MHSVFRRLLPPCVLLLALSGAAHGQGAPTITTTCPLPGFDLGVYGFNDLHATGGTLPYVWSVSGGSLPAGLVIGTFANPDSPGYISGTATALGTASFTLRVTDAASQVATLPCTAPVVPPPSVAPYAGPPALIIGQPFNYAFSPVDGTPPFGFFYDNTQLPPGLSFVNGTMSGTPTTVGRYTPSFSFRDYHLQSAFGGFTLVTDYAHTAPTVADLRPAAYPAGEGSFWLDVYNTDNSFQSPYGGANGYSFQGTQAFWDGAERTVQLNGGGALRVQILSTDVASPGPHSLRLYAAAPGGGELILNYPVVTAGMRGYISNPGKNLITVFDAGAVAAIQTMNVAYPLNLQVSPDGAFLYVHRITGCCSPTLEMLDALTGSSQAVTGLGANFSYWSMALSPAADRIFMCCRGGATPGVEVYDAYSLASVGFIPTGSQYARRLAVSPDGRRLYLSIFYTNGVRIHDTATLAQIGQVAGLEALSPDLLAFSRDGRYLLAVAEDKAYLVDPAARRVIRQLNGVPTAWNAGSNWRGMTFAADGSRAYVTRGSADSAVVDLDANGISTLPAPPGALLSNYNPALSEDGGRLFLGGNYVDAHTDTGLLALDVPGFTTRDTVEQNGGWIEDIQLQLPPRALAITTASPLPSAFQNRPWSRWLLAGGGQAPYGWTVIAGALPPGLTLSGAGALEGTPTTPGTYNFTVRATDAYAASASKPLQLVVNGPFGVVADPLVNATAGVPYSATLQVAGASGPVTWSVLSGGLPAGVTLAASTGVISGTPTDGGTTANFTVQATDGAASASAPMALEVFNGSPTIVTLSPSAGFADGQPRVVTINGTNFTATTVARWDGANRPTTLVSPTQVTVSLPGSDFSAAAVHQLGVFNPSPGGGVASANFQLCAPVAGPGNSLAFAKAAPNIALSWAAGGGSSFKIERCTGIRSNCTYTTLATQSGTTYNDPSLGSTFNFSYRISAQTACGSVP